MFCFVFKFLFLNLFIFIYFYFSGSSEDSDWSHQVGGAPFEVAVWPSIKTSRGGVRGSVAVATQETLAAVLARVGLTQHMDLFQARACMCSTC